MFSGLKPYRGASGGTLPEGWRTARLAAVGRIFKANGGSKEDDAEVGVACVRYGDLYTRYGPVIRRVSRSVAADRAFAYTHVEYGDVLFAASGETEADIGRSAVVMAEEEVLAGGDIIVLRPTPAMHPEYIGRVLDAAPFRAEKARRATGSMIVHISPGAIKTLEVTVPPRAEQDAIVKYLAHAQRSIDRAIDAKRRLIVLLEEQKQAVINQAVTRGLDASESREPSKITWNSGIPTHWRTVRLKDVARVQTGLTIGSQPVDENMPEFPYLRVANVQMGKLDLREVTTIKMNSSEASRYRLRPLDVLMTEGGDIDKLGRATLWREEIDYCLHQNHVFAVRCSPILDPRYLVSVLSTPIGRDYFHVTSKKTTNLAATNSTTLRAFPLPLPPVEEQHAIMSFIESENAIADSAISRTQREIELLEEFRTRLTADVVTGQVDVREIAASLPDIDSAELAGDVTGSGDDDLSNETIDYLEDVTA